MTSNRWPRRIQGIFAVVMLFTMIVAVPLSAQENRRMRNYVHGLIGPAAIIRIFGAATIDQIQEDPDEWDQDWGGFGQRLASNAGSRWVNVSVRHGMAALQHRTTKYQACECTDTRGRVKNAVLGAVTDFDEKGNRRFSSAQVVGAAAGSSAKLIWQPDYNVGDAALGTVTSLGVTAVGNILREFVFR